MRRRSTSALAVVSAAALGGAAGAVTFGAARGAASPTASTRAQPGPPVWTAAPGDPASAVLLTRLPDGVEKRKLLLDCTGCHQFSARVAYPGGRARSEAEWRTAVERMLQYGGARGPFPVIHADRDAAGTAAWLARHLPAALHARAPHRAHASGEPPRSLVPPAATWTVTEYALPIAADLPHDVAVTADGRVVVTGMMTDRLYVLDSATGRFDVVPIPIPRANPRAVEVDAAGRWWVALGAPRQLAVYDPARAGTAEAWRTFAVGVYPHSVALGAQDGEAWVNGHFTRAPELVLRVALAPHGGGQVDSVVLPPHPTLADDPGGPIPYEIRVAPDGVVWTSELHGNRLVAHDPRTRRTWAVEMPEPHSGPRRFDVDAAGTLWVPAYAANALVRYEPRRGRFTRVPLPIRDAVPYVARVDRVSGDVWVGTSAADAVLRYTPRTGTWAVYPLPTRGALVRHLAVDPRTHDVWVAYGASPGPAARIARLAVRPR